MGKLVSKDSIPSKFSPKNPKECIICGKMFIGASSNAKTCSPECSIDVYKRQTDSKLSLITLQFV